MSSPIDVSIVIPVHNDEQWIATALESCIQQTLKTVEVICVDDASTDGTRAIIERYQARDSRVRLIEVERNISALQCRRTGVDAARAEHVLFLDGDDELALNAAERSYAKAMSSNADLVGFAVKVVGVAGSGYESRLKPVHTRLQGGAVLTGLFPVDKPAQGQLWRHLYKRSLLRDAYEMIPTELFLSRVNDLPVMFLVAAMATRYVSIPDPLYRYYFQRGGSGQAVTDLSQFEFYLSALDSVDGIAASVETLAQVAPNPATLLDSFSSVRLSLISNVLGYLIKIEDPLLGSRSLELLNARASEQDVVLAATKFRQEALATLVAYGRDLALRERSVRSVLLVTSALTTGGVSGVLLSQARFLLDTGFRVTIAARSEGSSLQDLPTGAKFIEVPAGKLAHRVEAWAEICRSEAIDLVIDHQILYSRNWPAFALMAKALQVPTIGWIHNFALRPVFDQSTLSSFLTSHLSVLATLVTLSPLDVVYWKLRGIPHVVYLPNPPSPVLLESAGSEVSKSVPGDQINLVWVGRLEQRTKQVSALVDVAAQLRRLSASFHLTIIGPEWAGFTVADLASEVDRRGLSDYVTVVGPLRGEPLIRAIDAADVFVTTSVIEGYQLTLVEAQSRGLPVVMFELPWLTLVQDNDGIAQIPQGDAAAMAMEIIALCDDKDRYAQMSLASVAAAERARAYDFSELYQQLVEGSLPKDFSPEPTLAGAQSLIDWAVFYVEHNAKESRNRAAQKGSGGSRRRPLRRRLRKWLGRIARRLVRMMPALRPIAVRLRSALSR